MDLPKEVEQLLMDVPKPSNWVPDEYDVGLSDIMVDWREAETADIGLVGVPFDTAIMGRRGCRFGPQSVRNSLVFSNVYEPGIGTHERIEKVVTAIFDQGVTPVIIGGDHSIAYPTCKSLINVTKGNVGVIMLDSHLDVRHSHHGEVSSGTPFRRLMEEPERPVLPKNLVEIGINGWLNSRYYMDYCREMGVVVIPSRQVHRRGVKRR